MMPSPGFSRCCCAWSRTSRTGLNREAHAAEAVWWQARAAWQLPRTSPCTRSALLLLGGDKAGNWQQWYRENIPLAEQLYLEYTAEKEE